MRVQCIHGPTTPLNQDGFWTNYPKAGLHCGVVGDLWLVLIRDIFLYWNFTTYNSNDYWVFLNYLQFLDTRLLFYKVVVFQSNCFRHFYLPFGPRYQKHHLVHLLENNSLAVLAPFWSAGFGCFLYWSGSVLEPGSQKSRTPSSVSRVPSFWAITLRNPLGFSDINNRWKDQLFKKRWTEVWQLAFPARKALGTFEK